MKWLLQTMLLVSFVFLVAQLPQWIPFFMKLNEGMTILHLVKDWLHFIQSYLIGLFSGESLTYHREIYGEKVEGYSWLTDGVSYFLFSLISLVGTGLLAVFSGMLTGMWIARKQGWMKSVLEFTSVVPDFLAVILLQLLVIWILEMTDVLVAEVYTTDQDTAILLPLIILFYLPFAYVTRIVSKQTYQELTEDYILTAKAKGLSRWSIYTDHVFRNVSPYLKTNIHQISSIMIANLFIVETLFNSPGIIWIYHNYAGEFELINLLWMLIIIYGFNVICLRLLITGCERGIAHD
ncbi:ABC transporter permease subunit [Hazenella coriacea]|uniref:ABC-type dipeptide/oligopeptide/nickel transport system permease component n=1 Tax=Hazenella coriacea TaxID=1179467 RepID=A0A4R3LGA7_9BACL|nr:ABC transporter permease subunit [Hazenella coriacea]TCS96536.1 ABC-type dipeptide/oligopeptide/nickel transport system permease component [Hazenella coriacea]